MKPRRREAYWSLDRYFQPRRRIWYGNKYDEKNWAIGNVFPTRSEVQAAAKKIHAILKQDK
jgi:hypothetical protein